MTTYGGGVWKYDGKTYKVLKKKGKENVLLVINLPRQKRNNLAWNR
jgi:hypothetical protein